MAANPSSFGPADERLAGGDDAVGLGLVLRIKSTATSLPGQPGNEVYVDDGEFAPAAWIRCTSVEILQISPYRIKTTRIFSFCARSAKPVIILDRGDDRRFLNGVHIMNALTDKINDF